MSKTAHTPGPWVRHDTADYAEIHPESGKGNSAIALVGRVADANLIAASPELLQSLQGLLADIEDYQRINNLGGENNHWQVISRAVIAKATGAA